MVSYTSAMNAYTKGSPLGFERLNRLRALEVLVSCLVLLFSLNVSGCAEASRGKVPRLER